MPRFAAFPQCFALPRQKIISSYISSQNNAIANILYNFNLSRPDYFFSSTPRRKLLDPICSFHRFQEVFISNSLKSQYRYAVLSAQRHFVVAPSVGACAPSEPASDTSVLDRREISNISPELHQRSLTHISDKEAATLLKYLARNESCLATAVNTMSTRTRKKFMRCLFESVEREQAAAWLPGSSTSVQHAADTIFDSLDLNKDGQVTQREFRTWYKLHMAPSFYESSGNSGTKASSALITKGYSAEQPPSNSADFPDIAALTTDESTTSADDSSNLKELGYVEDYFENEDPLTRLQVFVVVIRSSIPYLGFGFIDNCLMIFCGDLIDHYLGVLLGISTLAAAGLGNLMSCATGVVTGGFIERVTYKLGLPSAHLSTAQADSRRVKNLHLIGSVLGICVGCFIGMFPLLLMSRPTRSSERQVDKDAEERSNLA